MKEAVRMTRITLLLVSLYSLTLSASDFPVLSGPYLGQEPPGNTPKLFAPGVLSTEDANIHSTASFTPDGKELYFSRLIDKPYSIGVRCMKEIDGQWHPEEFVPFLESAFSPHLSPDGSKLYCATSSIIVLNRLGTGWSEPTDLGPEINFQKRQDGASVTSDGTLYYTAMFGERDGIYFAKLQDSIYSAPAAFDIGYEGRLASGYPFVAPDESFVIFTSMMPGGMGMMDLYICFRLKDKTWTKPINMGSEINTKDSESFPTVSPDGKYIFFNSNRRSEVRDNVPGHFYGNIYWVSAKILETLRPGN
jgi:Tol biopolymer transport system component